VNDTDTQTLIVKEIRVERAQVAAAKEFVLRRNEGNTLEVAQDWAREVAGKPRSPLPLNESDTADIARQYARHFSAQLAVFHAVWELIASTVLMPAGSSSRSEFSITWRSGGVTGGYTFDQFRVPYPDHFVRSLVAGDTILADGDVFLSNLPSTLHTG
jgi:hypothetical protein